MNSYLFSAVARYTVFAFLHSLLFYTSSGLNLDYCLAFDQLALLFECLFFYCCLVHGWLCIQNAIVDPVHVCTEFLMAGSTINDSDPLSVTKPYAFL